VANFTCLEDRVPQEELSEEEKNILRFLLCRTNPEVEDVSKKRISPISKCQSDDLKRPSESEEERLSVPSTVLLGPVDTSKVLQRRAQERDPDGALDIEPDDLDLGTSSEEESEEEESSKP